MPLVSVYIKKLASTLVTQLIKEKNKFDLYLRFGSKWQVSLVGHMWPEDLFKINTILAHANFAQEHSLRVCKWIDKNLTVSKDPEFLRTSFNQDHVRAQTVADLANSKQNTSKIIFLPSAICFSVLTAEHKLREALQPWKNNLIRLVKDNISHSAPPNVTGNQHIDAIIELHHKAKGSKSIFYITDSEADNDYAMYDLLQSRIFMSLTDVMPPGFELKCSNGAHTALGEILTYYHYNMAIAYSDSQKPVFLYKRLPCKMEVTPYSPLILEAVKSPVFFSLQTDPNKEDNFFKPVTLHNMT